MIGNGGYEYEDVIKPGENGQAFRGSQMYMIKKETGRRVASCH